MKKRLEIETIECAGFGAMLKTLRLPYGKKCAIEAPAAYMDIAKKDIELLQKLILRGDEHAKALRMPQVWANITAPRWFWQELSTYEVGVTKGCSTSTMHQECKSLTGEELQYMISYQALRRIYFQRKTHRLSVWREFCEWIEGLPLSEELVTFGYDCK